MSPKFTTFPLRLPQLNQSRPKVPKRLKKRSPPKKTRKTKSRNRLLPRPLAEIKEGSNTKRRPTFLNGTLRWSPRPSWLNTTKSRAATFFAPLPFTFGSKFRHLWTQESKNSESKMLTSPCLCPSMPSRKRKIILKDLRLRLPGLRSRARAILLSQLRSGPPQRRSCIQLSRNGSDLTEICPWRSTSGPMWSGGNSSTPRLSFALENSCGKRDTQLMLPKMVLCRWCSTFWKSMPKLTKNSWLCQLCAAANLKMNALRAPMTLQLSSCMFPFRVEESRVPHLTIWAKTSQKCSTSCLRMRTSWGSMCGKLRGVCRQDRSVPWSWSTQTM